MNSMQIIGTVGALLLILGTAWLVLGRRFERASVPAVDDQQRVRIRVRHGYDPEVVELERGRPAVLEFQRDEDDPCSERVILDGFGRNVYLPPFATTEVEIQPERTGVFAFACGMGMLKGRIVVRESDAKA